MLCRPLQDSGFAYVYMDATYLHGRLGKALQVCSPPAIAELEDLAALLSAPASELQHPGPRPQVIEVAALPQGTATSITARGPVP